MRASGTELVLSSAQIAAIERHGQQVYPEECCGILIGDMVAPGPVVAPGQAVEIRVARLIAVDNQRESESRHNRYVIDPLDLLAAQKSAREEQREVVGYYHSHPDHPSEPSEFDRDHAWPNTSYLIVSVRQGKPHDYRSWRLRDDRSGFEQEAVRITERELLAEPANPEQPDEASG